MYKRQEHWGAEKQIEIQGAYIEVQKSKTSSDTFRKIKINQKIFSVTGRCFSVENYTVILFARNNKDIVITPLDELERREILKAIEAFGDTKEGKIMAADKLGIGLATLYRKLNQYK